MKYVYLIQSIPSPTQRYVGITSDLKTRLKSHNEGQSAHTSSPAWGIFLAGACIINDFPLRYVFRRNLCESLQQDDSERKVAHSQHASLALICHLLNVGIN